jgi:hypothetical protein
MGTSKISTPPPLNVMTMRIAECDHDPDKDLCVESTYESFARTAGVSAALSFVHESIQGDATIGGGCHNIMHRIGHVAVEEYGSFREAYAHGNYDCGNGYFHGVVEEAMGAGGEEAFSPSNIAHFCDVVSSTTAKGKDYARLNCVHGLGHALLYRNEGDLPTTLPECLSLRVDIERGECIAGAFMENMIERLPVNDQSDPEKNPSLTCSSSLVDVYRCWIALAAFVMSEGRNTGSAVAFCRSLSEPQYQEACGEGIGKSLGSGEGSWSENARRYCDMYAIELREPCIRGIMATSASTTSPFYSSAFGLMRWPIETTTDPLIGGAGRVE